MKKVIWKFLNVTISFNSDSLESQDFTKVKGVFEEVVGGNICWKFPVNGRLEWYHATEILPDNGKIYIN